MRTPGGPGASEHNVAPYGSWQSPISSDLIVRGEVGLAGPKLDGPDIYWLESRPEEDGRNVIVRYRPDGRREDVIPRSFNARTRVHEYGGGDFTVHEGTVFFSNFADQKLYSVVPGGEPEPLTFTAGYRYADAVFDGHRDRLIAVREDHTGSGREPVNEIVAVALGDGSERVLASGADFYSSPRLSPDGRRLAWLSWDHPNMPWDGTGLWVGELDADGVPGNVERIAGGVAESVFQPEWSPDGVIHFVSDRTGWWNLYRCSDGVETLCKTEAEFGLPQWGFGMSTYAFASPARIVCSYLRRGSSRLATLDPGTGVLKPIETPYSTIRQVRADAGRVVFYRRLSDGAAINGSAGSSDRRAPGPAAFERPRDPDPATSPFPSPSSSPRSTGGRRTAFFYPPTNAEYAAPEDERPPLLTMVHGGPTGATTTALDPGVQYWTSRGIAVLDVNYGGSTGYGREYRRRLYGEWGVVDVDDCANGAIHLAERGLVDGGRLLITGGSAGGYTTLCALAFRDDFAAGASHFGVSDAEALARETHKFESRYLDQLIGPYPERRDLYRERSPIHAADRLSCPTIFFQGLEDEVVPPNQAETMFEALKAKGLPVAYVPFEGEQHGFRRAKNIRHALDGELYFYSRVFDFKLAEPVGTVPIENLSQGVGNGE